jgi:hypothetical protein
VSGALPAGSDDEPVVDRYLLSRSRMQWQFGDWATLANIDERLLASHPDRAQLAMLVCAARLQIGDIAAADHARELVTQFGGDLRVLTRLLVSGVHNTLARAALLLGDEARVHRHFELSVEGVHGDARLASRARAQSESASLTALLTKPVAGDPLGEHAARGFVRRLGSHELGLGWAGNTINTAIFRAHGVVSDSGYQFAAFYVDETRFRVARRDLTTDEIQSYDIVGEYNIRDAHNGISIGVDRAGHLHASYDHHGGHLRYRKSLHPFNIDCWSDELPMTGAHEQNVTYPTFIQPRTADSAAPLLMLYRDGASGNATARLKAFDEGEARWFDRPTPILSGSQQRPWTSNAYWNHPVRGLDGSLHLSFVWRTHSIGDERRVNNINIGYAKSLDGGVSWLTSGDTPYRLPITQVNAEVAVAVAPGSNLVNQTGMTLDSRQQPHIVFYSNVGSDIPQIQHAWFDGLQWHHQVISARAAAFDLAGRGTLRIPISRPDIVVDKSDNVFVIHRSDMHENRMVVTRLAAPNYKYCAAETQVLWDADVGFCEPVIDRQRWANDGILTMLLQHTDQPQGDVGPIDRKEPVLLVELELT